MSTSERQNPRSASELPRRRGRCRIPGRSLVVGFTVAFAPALAGAGAAPTSADAGWPGPATLSAQEAAPDRDERDRAVRLAREGRFDEAIPILERLHRDDPHNLPLRADLAAILGWAGRDREAFDLGETLPFRELEPFVSEAVARSARNLDRPVFAAALYRDVVERSPDRVESHVGFTMAVLESGDVERAGRAFREARSRFPGHPEVLLAGGHVMRAAARPLDAALLLRAAGEAGADPAEAYRLETLSLLEGGAVLLAAERLAETGAYLHPGERGRVLADRGSLAVQWTLAVPETRDPADRHAATDRALMVLDSALTRVDPADGFPWRQLRFDRIVALGERGRMEEVLEEARELEAAGVELPPYVLRTVGEAHMRMRNPGEAADRFRRALAGWPGHPETTIALMYALVEMDRHAEAARVIRGLIAEQPDSRTSEGLREPLPNPDRLAAEVADHLRMAFAGDLGRAQSGLDSLSSRAPLNVDLRQEAASVRLWRGWPRAAEREYLRILALDPDHVGARVGLATVALDVNDRPSARAVIDTLLVRAPDSEHVLRLRDRHRIDGLWELSAGGHAGRSTGGEFGTRDDRYEVRLVTPPIADRVRLFGGTYRNRATYPDLEGRHERVMAGAEVRSRPVLLRLEATADRADGGRPGGRGSLALRPDDVWTLRLAGGSHAEAVPLQAARLGLDGWYAEAGLDYRWSERRRWSLGAGYLEISDGNRRPSVHSTLEQEILRRPLGRVTAAVDLWGATSSREAAPYFNPSRIASTSATLRWEWTLWRSFERSITQRIVGSGGRQFQEGFRDEFIYSGEYAQEWILSQRFRFDAGVRWGRPIYDDDRERRTSVHAGVNWRLPR